MPQSQLLSKDTSPQLLKSIRFFSGGELGLVVLCLFLFFWQLGKARLFDLDEGIYVSCARQMTMTGNAVTPLLNTRPWMNPNQTLVPFFEKPILVFWLCMASLRTFGITELAARLPVALASFAATLIVMAVGRSWFGRRAGLLAAVVYATAPMTILDARQMTTDAVLTLWFLIAMTAFRNQQMKRSRLNPILFWSACALAVLTKGVVGLLLPAMVIGIYLLVEKLKLSIRLKQNQRPGMLFQIRFARLREWLPTASAMYPLLGILIFFVIATPWHFAIWKMGGRDQEGFSWVEQYLVRQHVGRFKGMDTVHNAPPPSYFAYFLIGFFPWSCFVPAAFLSLSSRVRSGLPDAASVRFLLIWFWTIFGFFTLGAAKLPTYIVPAYPAAALLVGAWLDRLLSEKFLEEKSSAARCSFWAMITGGLLLLTVILLPLFTKKHAIMPADVSTASLHLTLVLFLGSLAAWGCFHFKRASLAYRRAGIAFYLLMMVGTVAIASGEGYSSANRSLFSPYQDLAIQARGDAKRGIPVIFYNIIPRRPSMLYYAADYSPIERKETPLLTFLGSHIPPEARDVDVITFRKTLVNQLEPEIKNARSSYTILSDTDNSNSEWVLLRLHLAP